MITAANEDLVAQALDLARDLGALIADLDRDHDLDLDRALVHRARRAVAVATAAEKVTAALAMRHAARDAGELGWYVAASFTLAGHWRPVADTLSWPDGLSDGAKQATLLIATHHDRVLPTRDELARLIRHVALRPRDRDRVVDELLERGVLDGGILGQPFTWGPARPGWSGS